MAAQPFGFGSLNSSFENLKVEPTSSSSSSLCQHDDAAGFVDGLLLSCFTEVVDDVTLYFQIIRLPKQIYVWIGSNSAKLGNVYAAAPTRPKNTVSVTSLLGGAADNTGSGIAQRLVLKTGLNIILASNIPKNSPTLELNAEKKLVEKLISLGYAKRRSD